MVSEVLVKRCVITVNKCHLFNTGGRWQAADLQRTFFRMKRNFEKKQKNIARAYSKERKEGEPHLPLLHLPATHLTMR